METKLNKPRKQILKTTKSKTRDKESRETRTKMFLPSSVQTNLRLGELTTI